MIAQSFDIVRLESGGAFLFRGQAQRAPEGKMFGVMVADEIIGNVIVELADLSKRSEADLVGRALIPSVLFHHLGPDMKGFMRYLARNSVMAGNAPLSEGGKPPEYIAMVGIPASIPIATMVQHLPFMCSVDVSHLISCNRPLFERLKPYLVNGSFELTEELYMELRLGL
jgi:hypothetical protein